MASPEKGRLRPREAESGVPTPIKTAAIVTRGHVEALLESLLEALRPDEPAPWWFLLPANEAQFAAALLVRRPEIMAVYDADDVLVAYRGIRLRSGGSAA